MSMTMSHCTYNVVPSSFGPSLDFFTTHTLPGGRAIVLGINSIRAASCKPSGTAMSVHPKGSVRITGHSKLDKHDYIDYKHCMPCSCNCVVAAVPLQPCSAHAAMLVPPTVLKQCFNLDASIQPSPLWPPLLRSSFACSSN